MTKQQLKEQIRELVKEQLNEFFGSAAIAATRAGLKRSQRQGTSSKGFKDSITETDIEGYLKNMSNVGSTSSANLANAIRLKMRIDSSDKKSIYKIYDLVEQVLKRGKYGTY